MSNVIVGQIKQVNYTNQISSKTSYPDFECTSDIDPQIRVTDGTPELEAGVGYHGGDSCPGDWWGPAVCVLYPCEDASVVDCISSLKVEGL